MRGHAVGWLYFLIVVGTAIWVGVDASNLSGRGGGRVGNTSTVAWVVICVVIWFIGLPVYLIQRHQLVSRPPGPPPGQWGGYQLPTWSAGPPAAQPPSAWPAAGYGQGFPAAGYAAPSPYGTPPPGSWAAVSPQPVAAPGQYAPVSAPDAMTTELERLGRLREEGHLTEEEFTALKGRIMR